MGAGSSTEQAGDKSPGTAVPAEAAEPGTPPEILLVLQEDQGAADAKVLHKNGQISPINGKAEEQVEYSFQTEDLNGLEAEVVVPNVGQRESTSVSQKEQASESLENMPQEESATVEISPKDAQETIDEMPVSEQRQEQNEQSDEAQSNEVGFKKVFKFVGFRFTVKKDKTEKTEPVQLLTVKKDEVEANGTEKVEMKTPTEDEKPEAGDHSKTATLEASKPTEEAVDAVDQVEEGTVAGKSSLEAPTEKAEDENAGPNESQDAVEGEKEPKTSPVSPTNPLVTETTSPFKKFFTQGWAGLRKKTSFKKTKEDDQQEKNKSETPVEASDSTLKADEDHTIETSEATTKPETDIALEEKLEISIADVKEPTEEPSVPLADISTDLKLEETDESDVLIANAIIALEKHVEQEEERPVLEVEIAPLMESKAEHEVVIAASEEISKEEAGEIDNTAENVKADVIVLSSLEQSNEEQELQDVKPVDELPDVKEEPQILDVNQEQEIEQSPPDVFEQKPSEGVSNEVELLSSQEKAKMQGSPLRKLFSGSSLKKLSGKKHKAKKEDGPKPEEATEQLQSSSEMAEVPEADKGDSTPSSPEEPVDALSSEKPQPEATQVSEGEGEGATSDGERKKDGITPWASFKKLVTPKKRVKKLSESDKEDEPEKAGKSSTMSSTDSGNSDNQEEAKVIEEEPKLEKSTEEPKRKVDSSVSWEALICVGSSKKRARKCSDSDEEETQKPIEEKPLEDDKKTDEEAEKNTEPETEAVITTSQESDQAQGGSSPEQAGSPSEGEGVSTWASFKRLVTPRRRSRTRMEEKVDEPAAVVNSEHPTSEAEPGKDESWVSFKKLIPGRKKKKSDGKPEHALVEEGQETVEDEDGDVPAVVPLSEYEAAEQEKMEAQQALQNEIITKETTAPLSVPEDLDQAEDSCDGLVHAVTVTVIEGERAVTSMEDRSPSWISARVTESIEHEDLCKEVQQTRQAIETDVVIEPMVVVKALDFVSSEVSGRTTVEMELTSEAVTALDEVMEASCAEETTEMVSAVSQLGESQATTEESTPVPEAENSQQMLEELQRQTQEVLKEVAEKVRHAEMVTSTRVMEVTACHSQRSELDIKDNIQKDIATMQPCAFDEASLTKEEFVEREMDQQEHFDHVQKVESTVIRKVSEIMVKTCLGAQEPIEVDQSHVIEDEDEQHAKYSIEEHERKIGEMAMSTLELKDTVIPSTIKPSPEPVVIVDEIMVVQQQYQKSSAPQDKLSNETEASGLDDENVSAVDSESVELLTGEEEKVDILEREEKVLEVELVGNVQNGLESTFNIATQEFPVIEGEVAQAVQANSSEITKLEILLEMKEQPDVGYSQTREVEEILQTEVAMSVPEVIQKETEIAGDESSCTELVAEQNEETLCFKEVIETKAEGIQTLLSRLVMLPQVDACEPILEQAKVEENEFVAEKSELEDNQSMLLSQVEEKTFPVREEVIVEYIPEVDACQAMMESVLITTAAAKEELVTETVMLLEASNVTLEPEDATATEDFVSISSDAPAVESQSEECVMESVSQTAAAIIDAAFEAIASSTADTNLENMPLSHGEELEGDAKYEDISVEIIQSQTEVLGEEITSQVSIDPQSPTFIQDHTQIVIKEVSGFDEELKSNYAPEISDDTPEVIFDCGVQGAADQVAAALEELTTDSPNVCESEILEILPSAPEQIDSQLDLELGDLGHTVSIEPQSADTVLSVQKSATEEVETAEASVAVEAAASALCSDATENISDDARDVKETVEHLDPEFNRLQPELEQGEASFTVSLESHSSTIVEKIIQTAVQEVDKVEEQVSPSELEVQGVAGEQVEEKELVNVAIKEGSDFSHMVITESYRSTVVETIVMTTVEEEEGLVCNSLSEVQSPVETYQRPEDTIMSEVQDMLEQTIEEPSMPQTENELSEGSCTVSIESQSTTVVETINQTVEVGDAAKEKAQKPSEVPCELESNQTLLSTGDHEVAVPATEEDVCSEGQEEADIQSSVEITLEVKEPLGLMQDIVLSDTCIGEESTISFQVAVEPTESVQPAHEVLEQFIAKVCQQTAAKDSNDLPVMAGADDQVSSDVAVCDVQCKIESIEIPEGTCVFETKETPEEEQIAADVESEVQNGIEIIQKTTEEAVCDSRGLEQTGKPSAVETIVEVKVGQIVMADLTESQACTRQTQVIELSDTCNGAVEIAEVLQQEHKFFEQLTVQVCQETSAEANNDPPVMEPTLLKEEIALQGEEDGQQTGLQPESQAKNVEEARPAVDDETTDIPAASSQECLEAAEQSKPTETEKTVEIQEQAIVVDSVLPSQAGAEDQSQASEDTSAEHVPHKHPHSKSESAES